MGWIFFRTCKYSQLNTFLGTRSATTPDGNYINNTPTANMNASDMIENT